MKCHSGHGLVGLSGPGGKYHLALSSLYVHVSNYHSWSTTEWRTNECFVHSSSNTFSGNIFRIEVQSKAERDGGTMFVFD